MSTYYFTYGTDAAYPYYGGWTEVEAPDEKTACALFKAYFGTYYRHWGDNKQSVYRHNVEAYSATESFCPV